VRSGRTAGLLYSMVTERTCGERCRQKPSVVATTRRPRRRCDATRCHLTLKQTLHSTHDVLFSHSMPCLRSNFLPSYQACHLLTYLHYHFLFITSVTDEITMHLSVTCLSHMSINQSIKMKIFKGKGKGKHLTYDQNQVGSQFSLPHVPN